MIPATGLVLDIRPLDANGTSFGLYPKDAELAALDRSDRKFVALAVAASGDVEILNAVDSDWWEFGARLQQRGIRVRNLCRDQLEAPAGTKRRGLSRPRRQSPGGVLLPVRRRWLSIALREVARLHGPAHGIN